MQFSVLTLHNSSQSGLCPKLSLNDSMATAQREIFASHFKWQNLALPTSSLDDVSVKHQCDPPECFHEALKEWLKRVKPPPPWETVAAAMRSPTVAEPHSAEKVEAKHIHPQHSLPQPSPMLSNKPKIVPIEHQPYSIPPITSTLLHGRPANHETVHLVEALENIPTTPQAPVNDIQIQILYGSILVFKKSIDGANGCRIFYSKTVTSGISFKTPYAKSLFGPPEAYQIALPSIHPSTPAKDIFQAMHRGILLEVIDGTIYITPLCQVVVHHASSPTAQSLRLDREKQTKVFDYANSFRPALERYALTHTAPPTPHAIFSLGQSWGPGRHVAKNFVSIVVTHLQAKDELDTIALPHTLNQDALLSFTPKIVEIGPNDNDREAEAFLQQLRYKPIN